MDPQRLCAPLLDSRLDRRPPISNSCWVSRHLNDMIAPTGRGCKRLGAKPPEFTSHGRRATPSSPEIRRHGIVSGIIIPPHFRPAPAVLHCDKKSLRWPGPFGSGFLSPQPPAGVRIGPVRRYFIHVLGK